MLQSRDCNLLCGMGSADNRIWQRWGLHHLGSPPVWLTPGQSWVKAIRTCCRWTSQTKLRSCVQLCLCPVLLFQWVLRVSCLSSCHLFMGIYLIPAINNCAVNFRDCLEIMCKHNCIKRNYVCLPQLMMILNILIFLCLSDRKLKVFVCLLNTHLHFPC